MDFFCCFVFGIIKKKKIIFKIHTQEKRVATYTSTNLKVVFDNGTWNYLHTAFVFIYRDIIFFSFFWKKTKKWQSQPDNQAVVKQLKKTKKQPKRFGRARGNLSGKVLMWHWGCRGRNWGGCWHPGTPGGDHPFWPPPPVQLNTCDQPFLKPSEAKLFFLTFFFSFLFYVFSIPPVVHSLNCISPIFFSHK